MKLTILKLTASVCRLNSDSKIPTWATQSSFFSISRTDEELSLVCDQTNIPNEIKAEKNWKIFKVEGPLDFGLTGILSSIANPLAKVQVSIFSISTFDTDYIMVKATDLEKARVALQDAGFEVN